MVPLEAGSVIDRFRPEADVRPIPSQNTENPVTRFRVSQRFSDYNYSIFVFVREAHIWT